MLKRTITIIKLCSLKFRFGKRLKIKTYRQAISYDTEIYVKKDALFNLDKISAHTNVHLLCVGGTLSIGNQVWFNRNCIVTCMQKISIGDHCAFGPNVCIYDHDHAYNSDGLITNQYECSDIVIEPGCWIGAGSIILRGTHIGKNSIIGAGSVVKGEIPPNSIATSNRKTYILPKM
jgi:acetyltransferase-like isoleucine patch superfamily enzyme